MSKQIHVGSVPVGGGADIAIQSMCNTRTEDVAATVAPVSYTHLDVYKRQHMGHELPALHFHEIGTSIGS